MPPRKILIVEDHPAIRNMLVSLFKNSNYQVTEASDGAIGLAAAQEGNYSAIILDLKMPQMDGFAFMKNLKLNPPTLPNGPIIVFSSASYDYAKQEALNAGVKTAPDGSILGLHEIRKSFGELDVLDGVDLTVKRGEVVCVLGPSGSGKSTLLRCINLLEPPDEGRIVLEGEEITGQAATGGSSTSSASGSAWSSSSSTCSRT